LLEAHCSILFLTDQFTYTQQNFTTALASSPSDCDAKF